jgi:hypothetical protein
MQSTLCAVFSLLPRVRSQENLVSLELKFLEFRGVNAIYLSEKSSIRIIYIGSSKDPRTKSHSWILPFLRSEWFFVLRSANWQTKVPKLITRNLFCTVREPQSNRKLMKYDTLGLGFYESTSTTHHILLGHVFARYVNFSLWVSSSTAKYVLRDTFWRFQHHYLILSLSQFCLR